MKKYRLIVCCFFFSAVLIMHNVAFADERLTIADENGFSLSNSEIIDAYNALVSGNDENYTETDESLTIYKSEYGKTFFSANIRVRKSTNQFGVFFSLNDDLINDYAIKQAPDSILIWTGARKELIEQDDSIEMLPQIFTVLVYLCDDSINDSSEAKQRAEEIINECSDTHDWVQYGGLDYYCATFPITEKDGHISIRLCISIKNHNTITSFEPI